MRALPLMLLWACGPADAPDGVSAEDTAWAPGEQWGEQPMAEPRVLMEGLEDPQGLAVGDGRLWVVEAGAGRIWTHDGDTEKLWADGLEVPSRIAADQAGAVVLDGDSVLRVGDESTRTVVDGLVLPVALELGLDTIWWVDEGTGADGVVGRSARDGTGAASVATDLEEPRGLALVGEVAVVAETGNWRLIQVAPGRDPVELVTAGGTLRDVAADCQGVYFATESSRWPNPGFISVVDGDDTESLSESPPEPDRVILAGDRVLWSTKQSIHWIPREGGTLSTVVRRSAIGDLVVWGETLIWSDPERGQVLAVGL